MLGTTLNNWIQQTTRVRDVASGIAVPLTLSKLDAPNEARFPYPISWGDAIVESTRAAL